MFAHILKGKGPKGFHWHKGADGKRVYDNTSQASEVFDTSKQFEHIDDEITDHDRGVQVLCNDIAREKGFPLENVSFSHVDSTFEVNGTPYNTAGLAYLDTGKIFVFPKALSGVRATEALMAHEIAHHQFETVIQALNTERSKVVNDPEIANGGYGVSSGMKPDGSIRSPELQKKYPLYTELHEVFESPAANGQLEKDDGVTPYSKDWWLAYKAGKVNRHQAMHETFAEIASLEQYCLKPDAFGHTQTLAKLGVKPSWRKLYSAFQKVFKKHTEGYKS